MSRPLTFAPHGANRMKVVYEIPPSCEASRLRLSVRFADTTGDRLPSRSVSVMIRGKPKA
jgi:hypothetical protein